MDLYQLSKNKLKQYIISIYCPKWKNSSSTSSKADTYQVFRTIPKFVKYFECIKNIKHLKSFTKLRFSDHKFMIEEERRKRPMLPRNEKIMWYMWQNRGWNSEFRIQSVININTTDEKNSEEYQVLSKCLTVELFLMTQENEKVLNLIACFTHDWLIIRNTSNDLRKVYEIFVHFFLSCLLYFLYYVILLFCTDPCNIIYYGRIIIK